MHKCLLLLVCLTFTLNLFAATAPVTSGCAVTCMKVIPVIQTGYSDVSETLADSKLFNGISYLACLGEREKMKQAVMQTVCPLSPNTPIIMGRPTLVRCSIVWKKTQVPDEQIFKCI